MTFLTERRLVKEGVTGRGPTVWGFVLVCFVFTAGTVFGVSELHRFDGAPSVTVSAWSVAFVTLSGFWGLLIAMWVALARGNRMPQTLEWLIFIASLVVAIGPMFVTGPLVKAYASARGYRFCSSTHQAPSDLTFAAAGLRCPPLRVEPAR